jgi:hypothetical protein
MRKTATSSPKSLDRAPTKKQITKKRDYGWAYVLNIHKCSKHTNTNQKVLTEFQSRKVL